MGKFRFIFIYNLDLYLYLYITLWQSRFSQFRFDLGAISAVLGPGDQEGTARVLGSPPSYDHIISYGRERCYDQKSNVEYSQWSTNHIPRLGLVMWAHIPTDLGLGLVL